MTSHGLDNNLMLPNLNTDNNVGASNSQQVVAHQMLALTEARDRQFIDQRNGTNSSGSTVTNHHSDTGDVSDAVVSIINISNDLDIEKKCDTTETMVKQCIRQKIWVNNKFLRDHTMKNMTITNRNNPNTILNLLLTSTRKTGLSDAHRFWFWKKYGNVVQKELNSLRTICTRNIKQQLMRGKLYFVFVL